MPEPLSLSRLSKAIALPLLLAGIVLGALTQAGLPHDAAMPLTLWSSTLLGMGLAFLAMQKHPPSAAAEKAYPFTMAAMLLALPVVVHVLGMRQFGGFDMSMVVDAGWRLCQGQRVALDFPNTTPPSFLLGPAWSFRLGGVSWQSAIDGFAVFSLVVTAWMLTLWQALLGRRWTAGLMTASVAAMALLPLSAWWYNAVTSAAAVVFALASACALRHPQRHLAWASWAAAVALLASAKPNVAGVLLLPITLLFLASAPHRLPAMVAGLLGLAGLEGLVRLEGGSLVDFIAGYRGVAARGLAPGQFFVAASAPGIALALAGLAAVLLPLPALLRRVLQPGSDRRLAFIGAATVLAGVLAFITTGEVKLVDLTIVLAGLMLCLQAVDTTPGGVDAMRRYVVALAILGTCLGLGVSQSRLRVLSIGQGTFFEYDVRAEPFTAGFFKGLTAGPRLHETHAEVARLLARERGGSVYFGPRMQWAYAAFAETSPVRQPLWWHPGVAFASAEQDGYVDDLLSGRFELMVFLESDYTYLPPDFATQLARRYERVPGFQQIDVYRRKPGA